MLNWFVLIGSLGLGVIAGLATRRSLVAKGPGAALGVGALVGIGGAGVMMLAVVATVGFDVFALIHVAYGLLTIGVPVAAAIVASRWKQAGIWVRAAICLGLVLAPIGGYATHIEPFWLRIDHHSLAVGAPVGDGIRIAVLSDLQTTEIGDYENRAIEALIGEEPDIVLIPGDFWQFPAAEFDSRAPQFAGVMQQIGAVVPHVFAVNGNTDKVEGLEKITEGTGVVVLDNEFVEITIDGARVRILGISFDRDEAGLPGVIDGFLGDGGEPMLRIVLAHRPDEVDRFSAADPVDVIVAGHTHGGQVAIPFFGPLVTLSSVPRSVGAGGLHEIGGHAIYVSTGVGRERLTAPQVRFGVRPSIGVLDLVSNP